ATLHACRVQHRYMRGRDAPGWPGLGRLGLPRRLWQPRPAPDPRHAAQAQRDPRAVEVLERLLKAGADPNRGDHKGIAPPHLAALIEDRGATYVLTGFDSISGTSLGPPSGMDWMIYTGYRGKEILALLLKHGADVNVKT